MHYYINDTGGWLQVSGDADLFAIVPPGFREVTADEFAESTGTVRIDLPPDSGGQGA